ncbi:MAG: hypothetical protein GX117_13870 [Candidatus Hydrogenedentes bacterium]|nr:hypothetical protein [Candidatus Hydrogenedentota bacterium]
MTQPPSGFKEKRSQRNNHVDRDVQSASKAGLSCEEIHIGSGQRILILTRCQAMLPPTLPYYEISSE